MGVSNKEVILSLFAELINGKNVDAIPKYFSKDYVARVTPYVGLGIITENSSQEQVMIKAVAKGGPTDGKLEPGDEIVAAEDKERSWENFEELKTGGWGQGVMGTSVQLTIRRQGELLETEITRGVVKGFEPTLGDLVDNWKHFLTVQCPDMKEEVIHIVEEGDVVAVFSQATGTIEEYKRQAIWANSTFFRMQDGKIVEEWGLGPGIEYFTQLGFKIEEPEVIEETIPG